jgi:hypothetical protein
MEATCSSETSDDFQRTTRRYIPEDKTVDASLLILSKTILLLQVVHCYTNVLRHLGFPLHSRKC